MIHLITVSESEQIDRLKAIDNTATVIEELSNVSHVLVTRTDGDKALFVAEDWL